MSHLNSEALNDTDEKLKKCQYELVLPGDEKDIKRKRYLNIAKRIALGTLKLLIVIFFLIFVIGPLIYKHSYGLQRSVVFLNFVSWPKNPNYSYPSKYGLDGVRNFYLTTNDDIKVGVWHILPENLVNESTNSKDFFENALNNGQNVIIYNHGNSGNRAAPHRVELYKVLRKNYHVIAFDYRSYGDSSDVEPTEWGLVSDSKFVYRWLANQTSSKIFVWGHSLGTGLSTHMLSVLGNDTARPAGLILESPFNNMKEEISEHPMSRMFKPLPWFHYTIVDPMQENNLTFASDQHILKVDCPILILHAEDDAIVPFKLGFKLYKTALDNRRNTQGSVKFVNFPSKHSYGHKYICRAPELMSLITKFETESIQEVEEKKLQ